MAFFTARSANPKPSVEWTEVLLRLVEAIAAPDESGSIGIGEVRQRLLTILLDAFPRGVSAAGLWLVDDFGGSFAATLWSWKHTQITIPDSVGPPSLRIPLRDPVWNGDFHLIHDQVAIQDRFQISTRNKNIGDFLATAFGANDFHNAVSEFLLPLFEKAPTAGIVPVGFLHFVTSDPHSWYNLLNDDPTQFARILSGALGSRITTGRQYRINKAVTEFQASLPAANTSALLLASASATLLKLASAVSCSIYSRNGTNGLRLEAESHSGFPSPKILSKTSFSYQAFSDLSTKCARIPSVDAGGPAQISPSHSISRAELPEGLAPTSTSWLSYVVGLPSYDGEDTVPFLLIRLLTTRRKLFLGGSFSATDQQILLLIANYLTEILPGFLIRETVDEINKDSASLQRKIRDRIAKSGILLREREFAKSIRRIIPSVTDVLIAEKRIRNDKEVTSFWNSQGRAINQNKKFSWWRKSSVGSARNFDITVRPVIIDGMIDIPLYQIDKRWMGLRCFIDFDDLPDYEWRLIEHIVGELRFAALGSFDVSERTIQIAELRHALNAGLTGLLGHLKVAADTYADCLQAIRDGESNVAVRRIFQEAQYRKSMERARLSGEQVSAFFEDTRVLLADITPDSLQKSSFDLPTLIYELRTLFVRETARRKIQIQTRISITRNMIVYDRVLLKLALFNLLDNAIKYSFSENTIVVSVDIQRYDKMEILLGVHNIGPFIPSGEVREEIFEPFRRVKHAGVQAMPGTGLGLAATRRIAEVHGGSVKVESVPLDQKGDQIFRARTSFTLVLPQE